MYNYLEGVKIIQVQKKNRLLVPLLCFLSLLLAFAVVGRVYATLGESADSVASDRRMLSAGQGSTLSYHGYTVREIYAASVTVREYISSSGVVFGIAWNGLTRPDLTHLLGSYAGEYRKALRQTPRERGRRSLRLKTGNIVVEQWGHMRSLHGRAYVPALIPDGVSADEIN
jgi:hypothetical protein